MEVLSHDIELSIALFLHSVLFHPTLHPGWVRQLTIHWAMAFPQGGFKHSSDPSSQLEKRRKKSHETSPA